MTDEEMKKAAEEYAEKHGFRVPYDGSDNFYDDVDVKASKEGFIAGAEWQAEKDARDMYMSDYRNFEKVYQLGRTDMREQLMKEAVEGYVVKDITGSLAVTAKGINLDGFKFGDKVRIIIVKEDGI